MKIIEAIYDHDIHKSPYIKTEEKGGLFWCRRKIKEYICIATYQLAGTSTWMCLSTGKLLNNAFSNKKVDIFQDLMRVKQLEYERQSNA